MTPHTRNAFVYASIVAMGGFLFGLDAALISGTVDFITQEFSLNDMQLGTAVSAPALGVLIALPFAGYISNRFGRKKAVLLVAALYLVSAVSSAFARSYETLVAARFLGGLAFSSISLASMYIGEIAPPKWRGKLVSMTQINIVVGLSGAYFVNYLIHQWAATDAAWVARLGIDQHTWRWMLGSEIPFALAWFGLLLWIPESPSWLVYRNRNDDAIRTLSKLLPPQEVTHHMQEMRESLQRSSRDHSIASQLKEIFSQPMRLTCVIAMTIAIAQQSTGINAILFYAQTVFQQLGVGTDAAFAQAIWVGLTSIVFTVLGLLLVDRLGRRPLIIWGMVWIIASLGLCSYGFSKARYTLKDAAIAELTVIPNAERLRPLAGVEYESDLAFKAALKEALGTEDTQQHQSLLLEKSIQMNATLVLMGILSFIGAFHFSVGPVMWVLFSEIFPISVRGIAIPFFTIITSLTNYLVQQFFPWQLAKMGMSSIFLSYAATVAVGLIILFTTLIETKNLSIEDIQIRALVEHQVVTRTTRVLLHDDLLSRTVPTYTAITMKTPHDHSRAIANNCESPHVKLTNICFGDCRWTHGFWADKTALCEEVMVPQMGTLLKSDIGHAYNNFKIAAGLDRGEARGMLWHDGDFFKWMESAVYAYTIHKEPQLLEELDDIIEVIGKAQADDGYLHTHVQIKGLERWSVVTNHELYNSGHLLTGACIHYRITGKSNWLDIAIKHADYLYTVFQPRPEALARFGFNPSHIMALVELYRTTRDQRYLELAEIFVSMRGSVPATLHPSVPYWFTGDQCQMRTPLRDETEATGHAVTGMYLYSGAADVYAETGEQALRDALDKIWSSAVERKMYVTGALGQVHHGARDDFNMIHEGFVDDYLMPNATAYNETCANIANAMFNWRMLAIKGEAKYADIMELVLHNSALVGISTDGKRYFYANPLRMIRGTRTYTDDCDCTESPDREPYIECFCCPPNLVRTIAQVSGWAYSLSENGVAVNLYGANTLDTTLRDGSPLTLTQETEYPWDGLVNITVQQCKKAPFAMMLRVPGWADRTTILLNGEDAGVEAVPGAFAMIERAWKKGDVVTLDIPMEITFVEGHPRIEEVRNQVAIKRGPLIYCLESPDLPEDASILDVYLHGSSALTMNHRPDFLGGVTTITGTVLLRCDKKEGMYRAIKQPTWKSHDATFVPYFCWSNRGTSEMTVFMPIIWESPKGQGDIQE